MIKTNVMLLLIFLFRGSLNAQVTDSKKCGCDSVQKSKIELHVMFAINGRNALTIIKPDNSTCETGIFDVNIVVNRKGEVTQAVLNTKISSKISTVLKAVLIEAALKSKFMNSNEAPVTQKGNITYVFRLKDNT